MGNVDLLLLNLLHHLLIHILLRRFVSNLCLCLFCRIMDNVVFEKSKCLHTEIAALVNHETFQPVRSSSQSTRLS